MELNKRYILNPNYFLRSDGNRAILTTRFRNPELEDFSYILYSDNFFSFIHPYLAVMLSFFSGEYSLKESIKKISSFFYLNENEVFDIIIKYYANKDILSEKLGTAYTYLPINLIIEYNTSIPKQKMLVNSFKFSTIDLTTKRLQIPLGCIIMLNTKCVTNCIYCYADKKEIKDELQIDRIKELIFEAKKIGMKSFDVLGGEFFLFKEWKELLKTLIQNDYHPYISTKVPLKRETIMELKNIGLKYIQISIDSINRDELQTILNVQKEYRDNIIDTINNLNDVGIKINTNTILTQLNTNNEDIISLLDYLSSLKNIQTIRLTPVSFTRYKTKENFKKLMCDNSTILRINTIVEDYRKKFNKNYIVGDNETQFFKTGDYQLDNQMFKRRSICTGNLRSFFILPNGDVTICEQMYWDKHFIIGNLKTDNIMDFWNSERAKNFMKYKMQNMKKDSKCFNCDDFIKCHTTSGICWKMVVENYTSDKWYYPDPRCPKSPDVINNYTK